MAVESPLKIWIERNGALLRLRLARPKANIVDAGMIAALRAAFDAHRGNAALVGVLLDAEGPHFSFGASVEEHLAARCAAMRRERGPQLRDHRRSDDIRIGPRQAQP